MKQNIWSWYEINKKIRRYKQTTLYFTSWLSTTYFRLTLQILNLHKVLEIIRFTLIHLYHCFRCKSVYPLVYLLISSEVTKDWLCTIFWFIFCCKLDSTIANGDANKQRVSKNNKNIINKVLEGCGKRINEVWNTLWNNDEHAILCLYHM